MVVGLRRGVEPAVGDLRTHQRLMEILPTIVAIEGRLGEP